MSGQRGHPLFVYRIMIQVTDCTWKELCQVVKLSTGETFYLKADSARLFGLVRGKVIDRVEYDQLKEESDRFLCKRKALDYLAVRNRSAREVDNYLTRKGFSGQYVIEAINDLVGEGYINDFDFAVRYIQYKRGRNIVGNNLLRRDLQKKGIRRDLINKALNETSEATHGEEKVYELACSKLRKISGSKNRLQKLAFFLYNRGFDGDVVRRVIERIQRDVEAL